MSMSHLPNMLLTAPSLRTQVLEYLRERILAGALPPGTSLSPVVLASQLGTSAMPVREALRALEQEGLVDVSARRFTRVAAPRRDVADEAYPLLGILESFALQHEPSRSAREKAAIANSLLADSATVGERLSADMAFHRAITSSAGKMLRGLLTTLYGRVALLEVTYHHAYSVEASVSEHAKILNALEARSLENAASLVQAHWTRGYEAVLPLLADN